MSPHWRLVVWGGGVKLDDWKICVPCSKNCRIDMISFLIIEYIPSPVSFKVGFNFVYYSSEIRVKLQERQGFKICCRHICVTDVRHSTMDFFPKEVMDRTSFIHIDPMLPS
jgi:hypothetical protein